MRDFNSQDAYVYRLFDRDSLLIFPWEHSLVQLDIDLSLDKHSCDLIYPLNETYITEVL